MVKLSKEQTDKMLENLEKELKNNGNLNDFDFSELPPIHDFASNNGTTEKMESEMKDTIFMFKMMREMVVKRITKQFAEMNMSALMNEEPIWTKEEMELLTNKLTLVEKMSNVVEKMEREFLRKNGA